MHPLFTRNVESNQMSAKPKDNWTTDMRWTPRPVIMKCFKVKVRYRDRVVIEDYECSEEAFKGVIAEILEATSPLSIEIILGEV